MVRLTDRPDMTLDVYRGRKTTMQQQSNNYIGPSPKREKEERTDRRKKNISKPTPTRTYCERNRPLPYCKQNLPSTIAPPDHPPGSAKSVAEAWLGRGRTPMALPLRWCYVARAAASILLRS